MCACTAFTHYYEVVRKKETATHTHYPNKMISQQNNRNKSAAGMGARTPCQSTVRAFFFPSDAIIIMISLLR